MTTNNHPAHGPVSLDRLHQIREILSKAAEQSDGGNLGYAMADAVKVIDEVLNAEPVAYMTYKGYLLHAADPKLAEYSDPTPLYDAPPAPTVPEELLSAMEEVLRISDRDHDAWHKVREGISACRAAMLQDGTLTNEGTIPVTQIKPVADLYGITSPTGSETSFTFDAVEARGFIGGGWTVQEYVELERYQKAVAGNSPVTPDSWIPVSERMPPQGVPLLVCSGNGVVQRTVYGFDGENWLDWYEQYDPVKAEFDDLWQPLPAAPKQ